VRAKLGSILFVAIMAMISGALVVSDARWLLRNLLIAAVTYCRMVREYTKDLGPFYTGWVSPNARTEKQST
jgi:hypothetical protein